MRQAQGFSVSPLVQSQLNSASSFAAYVKSLNNPWDMSPQRSGVDCGIPTALIRAYYSATAQVTSSQFGNMYIGYPRLWNPIYNGVYDPSGTDPSALWAYDTTTLPFNFPQTTTSQSVFEKARVSACSMRITPIASATNDQGMITFALMPPFSADAVANGTIPARLPFFQEGGSTDDIFCQLGGQWIQQHPLAQTVPFRHGATCYWRPQDPNSFTFQNWFVNTANPDGTTDGETINTTIAATQAVPFFVFNVHDTLAGTPPTVRIEMVLHLEATIASEYDGVVANGMAPHVIPAATAITAVRKVFGASGEKSGHVGTSSGMLENSGHSSASVVGQVASAVKSAVNVGGDVVSAAKGLMGFGSSLLSAI